MSFYEERLLSHVLLFSIVISLTDKLYPAELLRLLLIMAEDNFKYRNIVLNKSKSDSNEIIIFNLYTPSATYCSAGFQANIQKLYVISSLKMQVHRLKKEYSKMEYFFQHYLTSTCPHFTADTMRSRCHYICRHFPDFNRKKSHHRRSS